MINYYAFAPKTTFFRFYRDLVYILAHTAFFFFAEEVYYLNIFFSVKKGFRAFLYRNGKRFIGKPPRLSNPFVDFQLSVFGKNYVKRYVCPLVTFVSHSRNYTKKYFPSVSRRRKHGFHRIVRKFLVKGGYLIAPDDLRISC